MNQRDAKALLPTGLGGPWMVPITPALQGDWSEWIRVREVLPEKEAGGNGPPSKKKPAVVAAG